MKIVYYCIVYYTSHSDPNIIEIAAKPYDTKEKAEKACIKMKKDFGNKVKYTKVKRVDLSKSKDGYWL